MNTTPQPYPLLGAWHSPAFERKPDGMTWDDWQAWQPWTTGPGRAWTAYTYNVPLYLGGELAPQVDPRLAEMWAHNNAKRIDAIGAQGDALDLFEARRFAGWSAVAQLLGYRDLWLFNFPTIALRNTYLIMERCDDAVRMLATRHEIKTWCAGEPAPS